MNLGSIFGKVDWGMVDIGMKDEIITPAVYHSNKPKTVRSWRATSPVTPGLSACSSPPWLLTDVTN
jgi:hypothetical protein